MKRKSILFLFLFLLSIGLAYETQSITAGWMTGSQYGIIGISVPLSPSIRDSCCLGSLSFRQEVEVVLDSGPLFTSWWGFIAGWLSSFANTYFHEMIQAVAPNSDFWNQYESAIAGPSLRNPSS